MLQTTLPATEGVISAHSRPKGHLCGVPGSAKHDRPAPEIDSAGRGRPKMVPLSRSERYWIQHRIELLGSAASPEELRLLDKVML